MTKTAVAMADDEQQRKVLLAQIATLLKSPLYWIGRRSRR